MTGAGRAPERANARMITALVRPPSAALGRCEPTYLGREPIDPERAAAQHRGYRQRLAELGARVEELPPEPALADAMFVEDPAVVVDELAVITRPGATWRGAECASVAAALGRYRSLAHV